MDLVKTGGFDHIYEVEPFQKEFEKVVKGDKRYYKWLRARLEQLENFGREMLKTENFEVLPSATPTLYSIRYSHSRLNPRVIYIYANGKDIYLLTAFKESSKNGNGDYEAAIKIAEGRLKSILKN